MNDEHKKNASGRKPGKEELLLWHYATRDVETDKNADGREYEIKAPSKKRSANTGKPGALPSPDGRPAVTDRRTYEKLRRGKIPVDQRIDLHGMTQAQALDALRNAIVDAWSSGQRLVLVITGKGRSKADIRHWQTPEPGVLRRKLPEWLRAPPLDNIVLDFSQAKQRDGGEGAFYVLLRRKRS